MEKLNRSYEVDWLRIFLILSVFIFHIGMFFNTWGWHIKNNELTDQLNPLMRFLHFWRMPLLFLVSGTGTYFALGKKSLKKYALERHRRLAIPFIFGLFALVPIQVYLERFDQYPSLLNFYGHMFDGGGYPKGNFSWHHLWFVLYLLFISIAAIPMLKWFRSKKSKSFFRFIDKIAGIKGGLLLFVIPILVQQIIMRPYWPDNHKNFQDWAFIVMYLMYFLYGYIFAQSKVIFKKIVEQRYINLIASVIVTILLFNNQNIFSDDYWAWKLWDVMGILVAWFVGLTAMGFCYKYMCFDSPFRKYANEAIYPFYLLHQPVILLIGFFMRDMEMNALLKAVYLMVCSFTASVAIYLLLIRPFNFMRIVFGLKFKKAKEIIPKKIVQQ